MSAPPQPYLYRKLRLSLSSLFSLHPSGSGVNNITDGGMPTTKQAHDFLLQFQSRNIRRKHHSQVKSQRSKQQGNQTEETQISPEYEHDDMGSTWLTSIALLCQFLSDGEGMQSQQHQSHGGNTVTAAEALFAAQTLLHRLRRIKLIEAIDIEMEPNPYHEQNIQQHFQQEFTSQVLVDTHRSWSQCFHPILSHVVQSYQPQQDASDEERIKGELALISIATIIYCTVAQHCNQHPSSSIRPIISILGSCLAVAAARMRYTSISLPHPSMHTQPIVTMVLHSITMIREAIIATVPMDAVTLSRFQHVIHAQVVYACLAAIPDAILVGSTGASGGGAYGRLSIDPRCYTAIMTELKNASGGSALVWSALMDIQNSKHSSTNNAHPSRDGEEELLLQIMFLSTCEQWAKYVALPFELVQATIPVINQAFASVHTNQDLRHQQQNENGTTFPPIAAAAMAYWIALIEGGTWTVEQILTASLIQPTEASRQPNKKRQSSRSKKRNKEVLQGRTTNDLMVNAQTEALNRGIVACRTTMMTWETFWSILSNDLQTMAESAKNGDLDMDDEIPGNGPINGISVCANACLPHLLRELATPGEIGTLSNRTESLQLFAAISQGVQGICSSPARGVRAFAAETLYILHTALLELIESKGQIPGDLEELVVNHFFGVSEGISELSLQPCRV